MTSPDVVVIGAGMVGTATADLLSRSGCTVTMVESEFAGAGSTGAAMGHLVVMDDSPAQLRLCHLSRQYWDGIARDLSDDIEYDRCGTLWIAATEQELASARSKVALYQREGIAVEMLDPDALREAEPSLREGLCGALRVPGDGVCYPPVAARMLQERAIRNGVNLVRDSAVSLGQGRVTLRGGRTISCGHVVVAAGAQSAQLIEGLPVVPRKGHLCITDRTQVRVNHQLVELGYLHSAHTMGGASVAFNIQPRRTGQLLVGSSRELVGFDHSINRSLVSRMLRRAAEYVPAAARVRISRTWCGFRPATPDSLPLIGPWPAIDGVWIATGHEGLGITMAPVTAELIAAGITGTTPPIDPAPYSPGRAMPDAVAAA